MDRRKHFRVSQQPGIPVSFSGEAKGHGTLYDLSARGCKVGCMKPPSLGASLALQLHIDSRADPVKIETAVVGWTIKEKYFGVKFVRVEATEQLVLNQYLSVLHSRSRQK